LSLISSQSSQRSNNRPRAKPSFNKTLNAGRHLHEARGRTFEYQVALAEALLEEVGPPGPNGKHNESSKRLKEAHGALAREGIHFSIEYLRELRQFAHAFPTPEDRSPGCSFTVHLKAGNPETLHAVIATAGAEGKAPEGITVAFVQGFLKQRALELERKNRAAHDKLKNRPPGSDLVYVAGLEKSIAAAAKASGLADTSMPNPKSEIDRQRLYAADTEVIDRWTARRDKLAVG
jgi:hypothetical protein